MKPFKIGETVKVKDGIEHLSGAVGTITARNKFHFSFGNFWRYKLVIQPDDSRLNTWTVECFEHCLEKVA